MDNDIKKLELMNLLMSYPYLLKEVKKEHEKLSKWTEQLTIGKNWIEGQRKTLITKTEEDAQALKKLKRENKDLYNLIDETKKVMLSNELKSKDQIHYYTAEIARLKGALQMLREENSELLEHMNKLKNIRG